MGPFVPEDPLSSPVGESPLGLTEDVTFWVRPGAQITNPAKYRSHDPKPWSFGDHCDFLYHCHK